MAKLLPGGNAKAANLSYNLPMSFIKPIYAHCDGPCGHYETDTLKNGALTCRKVTEKLIALAEKGHTVEAGQQHVRYTMIKDEHAQLCKQQIYILWSDYFKVHHYEKYPKLQRQLYALAQLCSQLKQTVDLALVDELIAQIETLDKTFKETQA